MGQSGQAKVFVRMKGRGAAALNSQTDAIAQYIGERLDIEHIPAIRPGERAREIVNRLVDQELMTLNRDAAYRAAMARMAELEAPTLKRVADGVLGTLQEFLPDVRAVRVERVEERIVGARRFYQLVLDDGTPTALGSKGDGVQSIVALSLMRAVSSKRAAGRDLILAIEEPEAHLHPGAIHRLRTILQDISATTQVVMTTHHPAFVDRRNPTNNVIVQNSRARRAQTVEEIRTSLGVQASDNLRDADLVLLVEGEADRVALTALLGHWSPALRTALASGRLLIVALGGVDKLSYHASVTRSALCDVVAVLDADQAAKQAARNASQSGALAMTDIHFMSSRGAADTELEDMYRVDAFADRVLRDFGVTIPCPAFNRPRSKWCRRMEAAFCAQGKDWGSQATAVKAAVAEEVAARPETALHDGMRSPFDAVVASLERRIP